MQIARAWTSTRQRVDVATAQAVLGEAEQTLAARGSVRTLGHGAEVVVTVHPAWVLRQPAGEAQAKAFAMLVDDLRLARKVLGTERG